MNDGLHLVEGIRTGQAALIDYKIVMVHTILLESSIFSYAWTMF